MALLPIVLAGALLCNALPHLAAGLRGETFPTPFIRLHGGTTSSAPLNVLWGMATLCFGVGLLAGYPVTIGVNAGTAALVGGALLLGVPLSWHFSHARFQETRR